MIKLRKIGIHLLLLSTLVFFLPGGQASAATRTRRNYRGSALMYMNDHVTFKFNGSAVTAAYGYQDAGWIFPNIVTARGITKIFSSSSTQTWQGKYIWGAGVPTPWGALPAYNVTSYGRETIHGNGA